MKYVSTGYVSLCTCEIQIAPYLQLNIACKIEMLWCKNVKLRKEAWLYEKKKKQNIALQIEK